MRTFQISGPQGRWLALDIDLVRDALRTTSRDQPGETEQENSAHDTQRLSLLR